MPRAIVLNKTLKSNLIYGLGSIANSAALFLLVPYLVNNLSPSEFGVWSIIEITVMILTLFISAGLDVGLMREYWVITDEQARATLAGTVLIAIVVWGIILFTLLSVFSYLTNLHYYFHVSWSVVLLVLPVAYVETLFLFTLNLFRIREDPVKFVFLSIGRLLLFMGGAIVLVKIGYGLIGAITGRFIAGIVAMIVGLILCRRALSLHFNPTIFRKVAMYGLPLVPMNLAAYILLSSDRYFLQHYYSASIVGIYAFTYKIVSIFDVLVNRPFALDWAPRRFKIATLINAQQRYSEVLLIYLLVSMGCILIIISISPLIYRFLAPSIYAAGASVLPVLLLAALLYGLSYPLNIGIVIKDKTSYAAIIGIAAAGFCLLLNYWLIPRYGMLGAAWSTVFSYLLWTGAMTVTSMQLYPILYPKRKILMIIGISIISYVGIYFSDRILGDYFVETIILRLVFLTILFGTLTIILIRRFLKPAIN